MATWPHGYVIVINIRYHESQQVHHRTK